MTFVPNASDAIGIRSSLPCIRSSSFLSSGNGRMPYALMPNRRNRALSVAPVLR